MSLFDVSEVAVLDMLFGSGAPVTYELGLSTSTMSDTSAPSEPSGGAAYARLVINNDNTSFPGATTAGGVTTSKNGIAFTWAAATGNWGLLRHWFLYDTTNARYLIHGPLTQFKTIVAADIFRIPLGTMIISLD